MEQALKTDSVASCSATKLCCVEGDETNVGLRHGLRHGCWHLVCNDGMQQKLVNASVFSLYSIIYLTPGAKCQTDRDPRSGIPPGQPDDPKWTGPDRTELLRSAKIITQLPTLTSHFNGLGFYLWAFTSLSSCLD